MAEASAAACKKSRRDIIGKNRFAAASIESDLNLKEPREAASTSAYAS
ncbi:MAG TPA: hypothetical protein PL193_06140 [Xanthobacteraceae bacterium]|nr:hypothetical protein [Xanthobacteraceae bacterium]